MDEKQNPEYLANLRHSTAHLLAAAVVDIWPDAKLTIGPAIEDGFYYDIDFPETVSENDLSRIEEKMRELLPSWKEFTHQEVTQEEAETQFKDNPYKLELIQEIAERGESITLNTSGGFTDLCRGGHVDTPNKELGYFKLLSLAGAYWRGEETKPMLTRIYGTAFATKKELEEHLANVEEAKKRDHRKLGEQLDLFTFSPLVGPGLPLFTPRGTIIRRELEEFVQSLQEPLGYQRVTIPHITKPELYETSGHWDKFKEDLFHVRGKHNEEFVMKPMNCPHHTQIYASKPRSYRDLPLRYSEVTMVYRDEQKGELHGLSRVRSITQDDAHVFCRPDQIEEEINRLLSAFETFHTAFDFEISIRLSLRDAKAPEKYLGTDEIWEQAQESLRVALKNAGKEFFEAEGEAAFYGPKIDFIARDSLRRQWQLSTIQLDFNMPKRFELTYVDSEGQDQAPVMIHRAILGSAERFMAILLEHYAGNLPLWLSPTQVAILPISDEQKEYAEATLVKLKEAGIRAELDSRSESIGKKIREAELMKVPVMLIVGKKEIEAGTVAVRSRAQGDEGAKKLDEVVSSLANQIQTRS